MDNQPPQQQSELKFFLWPRHWLGWFWVLKRVSTAITVGAIVDGNTLVSVAIICAREALSAITDYSSARNPIVAVQQSTPPNTAPTDTASTGSE